MRYRTTWPYPGTFYMYMLKKMLDFHEIMQGLEIFLLCLVSLPNLNNKVVQIFQTKASLYISRALVHAGNPLRKEWI